MTQRKDAMLETKIIYSMLQAIAWGPGSKAFEQLDKPFNEALDPRSFDNPGHADDESSISQEEAEVRSRTPLSMEELV